MLLGLVSRPHATIRHVIQVVAGLLLLAGSRPLIGPAGGDAAHRALLACLGGVLVAVSERRVVARRSPRQLVRRGALRAPFGSRLIREILGLLLVGSLVLFSF